MTFQAYIDNIQKLTGKSPKDFHALAKRKGLVGPDVTATQFITWLADDFDLGRGHAMALWAVFKKQGWVLAPKARKARAPS